MLTLPGKVTDEQTVTRIRERVLYDSQTNQNSGRKKLDTHGKKLYIFRAGVSNIFSILLIKNRENNYLLKLNITTTATTYFGPIC